MNAFRNVDKELEKMIRKFEKMTVNERLDKRYDKYRKIGVFGGQE
jgi:acetyl-CoA carboxylase alpha subunit